MRLQSGAIEQNASLLKLDDRHEYNEHILNRAAKSSEEADRIHEAIKLYNLAGDGHLHTCASARKHACAAERRREGAHGGVHSRGRAAPLLVHELRGRPRA